MVGIYQNCSEDIFNQYLAKLNIRYGIRADLKIPGAYNADYLLHMACNKRPIYLEGVGESGIA
jgi:hypothetical protein